MNSVLDEIRGFGSTHHVSGPGSLRVWRMATGPKSLQLIHSAAFIAWHSHPLRSPGNDPLLEGIRHGFVQRLQADGVVQPDRARVLISGSTAPRAWRRYVICDISPFSCQARSILTHAGSGSSSQQQTLRETLQRTMRELGSDDRPVASPRR